MATESETDPFPGDVIEHLADVIGVTAVWKRRRLARCLKDLPGDVQLYKTYRPIPRPAAIRDQLARLDRTCRKLIEAGSAIPHDRITEQLGKADENVRNLLVWQFALQDEPTHPETAIRDGRAQDRLRDCHTSLPALRKAAIAARESLDPKIRAGHGGRRHEAGWPVQQTILSLGMLFLELTSRKPGISTDFKTREPSGPFVEFVRVCLGRLGWQLTPHAIRHHFRRIRKDEGW